MSTAMPNTTPKAMVWTGWALTLLVSLPLAAGGVMNVLRVPDVVKGAVEMHVPEESIPWIGVALLVSVALYLIPQTAVLGAILLTGYFGGAVMTHVFNHEAHVSTFAVIAGALTWLGIYLRDARLRALVPLRRA